MQLIDAHLQVKPSSVATVSPPITHQTAAEGCARFSHLPPSVNTNLSLSLIIHLIWSPSAPLIRTFPEFHLSSPLECLPSCRLLKCWRPTCYVQRLHAAFLLLVWDSFSDSDFPRNLPALLQQVSTDSKWWEPAVFFPAHSNDPVQSGVMRSARPATLWSTATPACSLGIVSSNYTIPHPGEAASPPQDVYKSGSKEVLFS